MTYFQYHKLEKKSKHAQVYVQVFVFTLLFYRLSLLLDGKQEKEIIFCGAIIYFQNQVPFLFASYMSQYMYIKPYFIKHEG